MHAILEADNGITFMASDVPERMEFHPGTNMSMALSGNDASELEAYFAKLPAGGQVSIPLLSYA